MSRWCDRPRSNTVRPWERRFSSGADTVSWSRDHVRIISDLPSYCVSQTVLIYQISAHQRFHPDIADELFVPAAVAKSKDLAARKTHCPQRGVFTGTQEHEYYCYTDKNTVSTRLLLCIFLSFILPHFLYLGLAHVTFVSLRFITVFVFWFRLRFYFWVMRVWARARAQHGDAALYTSVGTAFSAPKCKCSPFVRASHLCSGLSLSLSVVSRRGACGATACTAAAAIRYPGSRSPESWREEQHPTPPPPRPPHPRPDTPLSPPCRGSTWSRRAAQRSLLPPWPLPPPALLGTGADLITLPPALQPLPVTSENSAGTQCVTQRGKVPSDPRWRETSVIRNRLLEQESFWMLLWFYI